MPSAPPRSVAASARKRSPTTCRTAMSFRSANAATMPATASFSTFEPSEPPNTATTNRSPGNPSVRSRRVARAGTIQVHELLPHRRTSERCLRQRRPLEGNGAHGREAGADATRETGQTVVANDDEWNPLGSRRERRREARVTTDRHHDCGTMRLQQAARAGNCPHELEREGEVARRESALQADDIEELVRVVGRGQQPGLDPRCAPM